MTTRAQLPPQKKPITTDVQVRKAKPNEKMYKWPVEHGLYLEVQPNGSKFWRYRFRIGGKETIFALGKYPQMGLAEAKKAHEEARILVKQGINPSTDKKLKRTTQINENENTFQAVALEWWEKTKREKGWTDYYARQIKHTFEVDVFPRVGSLPIRSIDADHMLPVLERIEKRGANTVARLTQQWCSAVFNYAVSRRKASANPMLYLRGTIKCPDPVHHRAMPENKLPAFLRAVDEYTGHRITTIAMKLLLLTFVRTGELRQAVWSEFDFEKAEWTIPGPRMKMRKEHIVPLSRQAVELLKELQTFTGGHSLLFPNLRQPNRAMTNTTINRALERLGYSGVFSGHCARSTASTILNESGLFRWDVVEISLAHGGKTVRKIYNQATYKEERQKMMQYWADHLDNLKGRGNVTSIFKKAANE